MFLEKMSKITESSFVPFCWLVIVQLVNNIHCFFPNCYGRHTPTNDLRSRGCCWQTILVYGVVWHSAQLVAEIQSCLKLFAHTSGAAQLMHRIWVLCNICSFFSLMLLKGRVFVMASFINNREFFIEFIDQYRKLLKRFA